MFWFLRILLDCQYVLVFADLGDLSDLYFFTFTFCCDCDDLLYILICFKYLW